MQTVAKGFQAECGDVFEVLRATVMAAPFHLIHPLVAHPVDGCTPDHPRALMRFASPPTFPHQASGSHSHAPVLSLCQSSV